MIIVTKQGQQHMKSLVSVHLRRRWYAKGAEAVKPHVDSESFNRMVYHRHRLEHFDSQRKIPEEQLAKILEWTQVRQFNSWHDMTGEACMLWFLKKV